MNICGEGDTQSVDYEKLKKLGVGADCSSMAELILAETVGITGEEIVFLPMTHRMKSF